MIKSIKIKTDWRRRISLEGILLEDSFILDWTYDTTRENFLLKMEFSLWPDSPYYEKPKLDDWTCYKNGAFEFNGILTLSGFVDKT